MISAPSNFNHISHMGPGDGIQMQRLLDLPSALDKADFNPHPAHLPAAIPLPGMSSSSSTNSITGSPSHLVSLQQQQGIQRVLHLASTCLISLN